jgi:GTPase SAR1 family protein
MLPKEPTKRKTKIEVFSILLYGAPKIGKTTLASKFPKPLFLATEPGLDALDTYQVNVQEWKQMLDTLTALKREQHDFKTVVVDTLDNAYLLCSKAVCQAHGKEHESDFGHGKGWALVRNEFQNFLTRLVQLPTGTILISHSQTKEIDTPAGKVVRTVPALPGRTGEIITGFVAMILYIGLARKKENDQVVWERTIFTQPCREWEAGDRTGLLPKQLPLIYEAFAKCFKGDK